MAMENLASEVPVRHAAATALGASSSTDVQLALGSTGSRGGDLPIVPPLPPVYVSPRKNNKKLKKGTVQNSATNQPKKNGIIGDLRGGGSPGQK